jgi:hypothetical protein
MNSARKFQLRSTKLWLIALLGLAALLLLAQQTLAQDGTPTDPTPTGPPLHPNFALLDADGNNVLDSGAPISTMNTCGTCHDTEFIAEHSFHVDAGLSEMSAPGETGNGRSWDISTGTFGKWNPLVYHYLTPAGDDVVDLTTPGWLMLFSDRHVGGGPAVTSRDWRPAAEFGPRCRQFGCQHRRPGHRRTGGLGLAAVWRGGNELLPLPSA